MYLSKKVNVWIWLLVRIVISIVIIVLLSVFHIFDFFCASSVPRLSNCELDPNAKVIVTLNDNTGHIPGCVEITVPTETMRYGAAIGDGIKPCQVCINEDNE